MPHTRTASSQQMARTSVAAIAVAGFLAAGPIAPAVAKPRADKNGHEYCLINNYSEVGGVTYLGDDHKCCFWEKTAEGEAIHLCLECDENWENCEEVFAARRPGLSTMPGGVEAAPLPGRQGAGTPARRLNRTFKLQRRVE